MEYSFRYGSNSSRKYEQNEKETLFLDTFIQALPDNDRRHIHLNRMSDGTISVYYDTYPIGKIKLQGRKFQMQILKGLYNVKDIEGDVEVFIQYIPDWCRYIKYIKK